MDDSTEICTKPMKSTQKKSMEKSTKKAAQKR
jgi:hypothetical protein